MKRFWHDGVLRFAALGFVGVTLLAGCGDDGGGGSAGAGGGGGTGGTAGSGGGSGGDGLRYEDPTGASGTRLTRRYLAAGPGAYMTVDFIDQAHATACSFGTAADGVLRCLPDNAAEIYFSDAGCSEPVMRIDPDDRYDCGTGWARARGDRSYYRQTDRPAVLDGGRLYYRSGATCQTLAPPAGPTYWVAEKVVSAEFVRGERDDEARTDGMVARYVDGEDGSRALLETVHGTHGYTCEFGAEGHCLPIAAPSWGAFANAGCTEAAVGYYKALDAPGGLIRVDERGAGGCPSEPRVYRRGGEVTEIWRVDGAGACVPAGDGSGIYRYFRIGEEVPLGELPRASHADEGAGELLARRWVDQSGAPLGTVHEFWDTTRDETCEPLEFGDGFACLPVQRGLLASGVFSDAACSAASAIAQAYCQPTAPRLVAAITGNGCRTGRVGLVADGVFECGAPTSRDYFFENDVVTCEPRTFGPGEAGYSVGPEVTDLPVLVLDVE